MLPDKSNSTLTPRTNDPEELRKSTKELHGKFQEALEGYYQGLRDHWIRSYRQFLVRKFGRDQPNYGKQHIPAWDGGLDDSGRRRARIWPKIVNFCLHNGLDPYQYICVVLEYWDQKFSPSPSVLCQPTAYGIYQKHKDSSTNWLSELRASTARLSVEIYRRRVGDPEEPLAVAMAEAIRLSREPALVKLLVAEMNGLPADDYYSQAALGYLSQEKDLKPLVYDLLPERFLQYIDLVRLHLNASCP